MGKTESRINYDFMPSKKDIQMTEMRLANKHKNRMFDQMDDEVNYNFFGDDIPVDEEMSKYLKR